MSLPEAAYGVAGGIGTHKHIITRVPVGTGDPVNTAQKQIANHRARSRCQINKSEPGVRHFDHEKEDSCTPHRRCSLTERSAGNSRAGRPCAGVTRNHQQGPARHSRSQRWHAGRGAHADMAVPVATRQGRRRLIAARWAYEGPTCAATTRPCFQHRLAASGTPVRCGAVAGANARPAPRGGAASNRQRIEGRARLMRQGFDIGMHPGMARCWSKVD